MSGSVFSIPQSAIRNPQSFSLEWDPRLVEEAVLLAVDARQVQGFRGERNRLYEIQDPEEREAAFRKFHVAWFERLNLAGPFWQALREQPLIPASTRACVVAYARTGRDEGAELFVSPGGEGAGEAERRSVGVRLLPQRFLDEEELLAFLRHELFHITDMLDPAFGYEPRLPKAELGPAHERLLQDRYRVLWYIYIDGRLVHRNWTPPLVRARRLEEFARTFTMLGDRVEEAFSRFFDNTSLTHSDLVSFAINPAPPASVLDSCSSNSKFEIRNSKLAAGPRPHAGQRCPLCGFPTHAFQPDPDQLPADVVDRIRADFPTWEPSSGLCQQCSDLYRSRSLSAVTTS
jgi:hypothetical protein